MPHRVGQGLLDNPVGRHLDARGKRVRRPFKTELDRHARAPHLLQHHGEFAQRRRGLRLQLLGRAAQHAEKPAQLGQRLPRRVADDLHGVPGLGRMAGQQRRRRLGLDGHQADVMGHYIVQLPGDPGPLNRGGSRRFAVAVRLSPGRAGLDLVHICPPGAGQDARHPGGSEDERGDDEVIRLVVAWRQLRRRDRRQRDDADEQPMPRPGAVHRRVERDRRPERKGGIAEADQVVGHPGGADHGQYRDGP